MDYRVPGALFSRSGEGDGVRLRMAYTLARYRFVSDSSFDANEVPGAPRHYVAAPVSYRRLWGAACPCCRVALARGADGRVLAAWRKHYPGNVRDVVVTPLDADARAVRRVHDDDWVYPGCPHTGPAVAPAISGTHVVWYSGKKG